ncbi:MAG: hypothetical protein LBS49_02105 [Candidatus Accumulibacter sp.]|jgi:hypothetical protein|nr:hypothetical protein [Accumulibacter sp.]
MMTPMTDWGIREKMHDRLSTGLDIYKIYLDNIEVKPRGAASAGWNQIGEGL